MIETGIDGLKIKKNKVVKDDRGILSELSKGWDDPFLSEGVKNIYASVATGKHKARAGHYHYRNVENFFTLSGTALWYFKDYRKNSPTYNQEFMIVLGSVKPDQVLKKSVETLTIDDSKMAQILVPTGVFHIFWPLTEDNVIVLAIASEPYDREDYWRADEEDIKKIEKKLKEVIK